MENQEEYLDEQDTGSVNDEISANTGEDDDDNPTNNSQDKNKSNFKALYKSNKEKERLITEQTQRLEQLEEELSQWRELNPEVVETLNSKEDINSVKEEIFTIKNPEAAEHIDDIRKAMKNYNMDINTAWKFVKIDIPQESKTKNDFSVGKTANKKITDFTQISPEDALNLSKEDQSKWRKIN